MTVGDASWGTEKSSVWARYLVMCIPTTNTDLAVSSLSSVVGLSHLLNLGGVFFLKKLKTFEIIKSIRKMQY